MKAFTISRRGLVDGGFSQIAVYGFLNIVGLYAALPVLRIVYSSTAGYSTPSDSETL